MGELNQHNLDHYISSYELDNFVETGTGKGVGLLYALHFNFKKFFSIEIMEELHKQNLMRFSSEDRVSLYLGDSFDGLKEYCYQFPGNRTLFWLDAHFPGADFHFNDYHKDSDKEQHMPLKRELEIICSADSHLGSVFIIDDLRIYEPDASYELGRWDLADVYGGGGIGFIEDLLLDTHTLERDFRHQGFLIATPKES